jgi:hypothetical protein
MNQPSEPPEGQRWPENSDQRSQSEIKAPLKLRQWRLVLKIRFQVTSKRSSIDPRLVLPRAIALVAVAGWCWHYSATVSAMLSAEGVERELQDIQIPAGRHQWLLRPIGGGRSCRGVVTTELRTTERERAKEELDEINRAVDSSLPQQLLNKVERQSAFSIRGKFNLDLLGKPFPADFQSQFVFDESFALIRVEGSLHSSGAALSVSTDAPNPLTLNGKVQINSETKSQSYVVPEPIFLVLNRRGDGTLKLPRSMRDSLKSFAPNPAASTKLPFQVVSAKPDEAAECLAQMTRDAGSNPPNLNFRDFKFSAPNTTGMNND